MPDVAWVSYSFDQFDSVQILSILSTELGTGHLEVNKQGSDLLISLSRFKLRTWRMNKIPLGERWQRQSQRHMGTLQLASSRFGKGRERGGAESLTEWLRADLCRKTRSPQKKFPNGCEGAASWESLRIHDDQGNICCRGKAEEQHLPPPAPYTPPQKPRHHVGPLSPWSHQGIVSIENRQSPGFPNPLHQTHTHRNNHSGIMMVCFLIQPYHTHHHSMTY